MARSFIRGVLIAAVFAAAPAKAADFSYEAVASRYSETALDDASVNEARMQGECLVGIKKLNFRRRSNFDPIAEWSNFRTTSLLRQFPPCTVLIMIEVARAELLAEEEAG